MNETALYVEGTREKGKTKRVFTCGATQKASKYGRLSTVDSK